MKTIPDEIVAEVCRLETFRFPGEEAPAPEPLPAERLSEILRAFLGTFDEAIADDHPALGIHTAGIMIREILRWLAINSDVSRPDVSSYSQACLFQAADMAVRVNNTNMSKGQDATISMVQHRAEIPGMVSRNPEHSAIWQDLLCKLEQGSKTAMPYPKGKKAEYSITNAYMELVSALHDYIQRQRANPVYAIGMIPSNHPAIHPLVREMLSLEEFDKSAEEWVKWSEIGWKLIEHFTDPKKNHSSKSGEAFFKRLTRSSPPQKGLKNAWQTLSSVKRAPL